MDDPRQLRRRVLEALFVDNAVPRRIEGNDTGHCSDSTEKQDSSASDRAICSICLETIGMHWSSSHHNSVCISRNDYCDSDGSVVLRPPHTLIERLETKRSISMPLCQHTFHHQCIMSWMLQDHDDCPTCRQPLWEPEAYDAMMQHFEQQVAVPPTPTFPTPVPRPPIASDPARQEVHERRRKRLAHCIAFGLALQVIVMGGITLLLIFRPTP